MYMVTLYTIHSSNRIRLPFLVFLRSFCLIVLAIGLSLSNSIAHIFIAIHVYIT